MKCSNCRKAEAVDTRMDRIKRWLFYRLFPVQIQDLSSEKYTQGFGDGYTMGFKHVKQNENTDRKS